MSREKVSTEFILDPSAYGFANAISLLYMYRRALGRDCTDFECRRISVIVYRSASDKLAVDSLVLLVWDVLNLIPPKRQKEYLANCFQSKIC